SRMRKSSRRRLPIGFPERSRTTASTWTRFTSTLSVPALTTSEVLAPPASTTTLSLTAGAEVLSEPVAASGTPTGSNVGTEGFGASLDTVEFAGGAVGEAADGVADGAIVMSADVLVLDAAGSGFAEGATLGTFLASIVASGISIGRSSFASKTEPAGKSTS